MNIFKHWRFSQWAQNEGISDENLKNAVEELSKGLFEANLGSGLYKKRIARLGQGKSPGHRTLVAFKKENRSIFVFGFSKNEQSNIEKREKKIFKRLAKDYLSATADGIKQLLINREIIEVK